MLVVRSGHRLTGTGIQPETADRWLDAWVLEATGRGLAKDGAYWQAGWDWIAAQREPLGKLLEADSAAADAVAAATRRLEEQRAEPPPGSRNGRS